jgi:hypothetical protein
VGGKKALGYESVQRRFAPGGEPVIKRAYNIEFRTPFLKDTSVFPGIRGSSLKKPGRKERV